MAYPRLAVLVLSIASGQGPSKINFGEEYLCLESRPCVPFLECSVSCHPHGWWTDNNAADKPFKNSLELIFSMASLNQQFFWLCVKCDKRYSTRRNALEHSCVDQPEDRLFCLKNGCDFSCWQQRVMRRHCEHEHNIKPANKAIHWEDREPEHMRLLREERVRPIDAERFPLINFTLYDLEVFTSQVDSDEADE
ncbi:hypothetical protein CONPUDRAFT_139147 [Coniophora puteana RWD-64-598 SS2]|uniref:Uncharacterized protein n=1 Tax=Coniophora puteana (strain RWD-64-598) TaxID=741705 RepID=A0A5M3MDY5_CONPW|nr:uncharacterized protein CONPUDRAFT_139147 [Coniophora puteana RWD-64-598 SS2]EIW77064.1 hypothetical protein CONPUDRAFT_139147 [Coniophora puteana RWD-64-598 SS2]